jgi:hypothetical protein
MSKPSIDLQHQRSERDPVGGVKTPHTKDKVIHVILDNYATGKQKVRAWVPRLTFHWLCCKFPFWL